jgi:hypothetical protein
MRVGCCEAVCEFSQCEGGVGCRDEAEGPIELLRCLWAASWARSLHVLSAKASKGYQSNAVINARSHDLLPMEACLLLMLLVQGQEAGRA